MTSVSACCGVRERDRTAKADGRQRLTFNNSRPVLDPVARVENDSFSGYKPFSDFDRKAVPLTDGDRTQTRPSLCGDKDGPFFALPEQSAERQLEDLALEQDDLHVDSVTMSERTPTFRWIGKIEDDVDPLLLDSERRHLGLPEGLDSTNDCVEVFADPALSGRRPPRGN